MRAIWKGAISFGLVNIPVGLYSATRREELKFRLLRRSDLSPINYKRVAEVDGKEVPWDEIVKGYEYEKGKFIVLKEEDFQRVDVEATQTVDITDFVELADINPMFFQKPYFMEPLKGGEKAYALLREALTQTGRVGIAKVVIKDREHLAAVKPSGPALVLELMHFADELIPADRLNLPDGAVGKKELEMAKSLVESMSDEWEPTKYTDDYKTALLELIQKKIEAGGKELPELKKAAPKKTNVIDLVDVLQESIDRAKKKPAKKTASTGKSKKKAA